MTTARLYGILYKKNGFPFRSAVFIRPKRKTVFQDFRTEGKWCEKVEKSGIVFACFRDDGLGVCGVRGGSSSNKDQNPGIDTPGGDENDGDNNNNNNGGGKEKRNGNEQDFYLDYFRLTAV